MADDDMIFDIGPKSAQELADIIAKAGTVVWNGPVGVFEFDQFGGNCFFHFAHRESLLGDEFTVQVKVGMCVLEDQFLVEAETLL